jgi:hypothetical protein
MITGKKSTTPIHHQTHKPQRRKLRTLRAIKQNPLYRFARKCEACGALGAYNNDILCFECKMLRERINKHYIANSDIDANADFNIDDFY